MSWFRKLSIVSVCLTIIGQIAGWGGADGSAETTAEIGMLLKTFGGGSPSAEGRDGKMRGPPAAGKDAPGADPTTDPAALLAALLK